MNKVLFSSVGASVSIDKHDSILDALQKAKEASLPFDSGPATRLTKLMALWAETKIRYLGKNTKI